jgi:hypothetical protein
VTQDLAWFVGSSFGGVEDQTERFLRDGIWEISNPSPEDSRKVRSMLPGQRIAMKATLTRKNGLPFDNRGNTVSVMRLKARGTITSNPGDGELVTVAWDTSFKPREWYFNTYRRTIWEVSSGEPMADALIAFAFNDKPQDFDLFLKNPFWAKRFGPAAQPDGPRIWVEKTLVAGRPDREAGEDALGRALWSPQRSKDGRSIYGNMLQVRPGDIVFHLTDNDSISHVSIAAEKADETFTGLPDTDWSNQPAYRIALKDCAALSPPLPRDAFLKTEPFAGQLKELVDSGARGLFYNARLELNQGAYLTEATPSLMAILNRAYHAFAGKTLPFMELDASIPVTALAETEDPTTTDDYDLEEALEELFFEPEVTREILLLWQAKKNVILQGPPGVGKSFAARRLAYALMGKKDPARVGFVQFHQSYSYEDFVEGFRPTVTGFELKPGKFVQFCRMAEADPKRPYVFIIDEINRGNMSKILGELMLLIEADKRSEDWSLPLASGSAPFYVPANVYILGLMNTADRSLAVVDYALRRRFAFIDVQPALTSRKFRDQMMAAGVSSPTIDFIVARIGSLNAEIIGDRANLGPGFAIGHSFFCDGPRDAENERQWYERIIRTEIAPLLREYWFDAPSKADNWTKQLLSGP